MEKADGHDTRPTKKEIQSYGDSSHLAQTGVCLFFGVRSLVPCKGSASRGRSTYYVGGDATHGLE